MRDMHCWAAVGARVYDDCERLPVQSHIRRFRLTFSPCGEGGSSFSILQSLEKAVMVFYSPTAYQEPLALVTAGDEPLQALAQLYIRIQVQHLCHFDARW